MLSNKDFYPTPIELMRKWLVDLGNLNNKVILEPSAGKGDIVDYINNLGYYDLSIDAIEKDLELTNILYGKGINVVWDDFLTYKTYKEYDFIVMNPPFSNGVDHLLHAIKLSEGNKLKDTTIYCILNKNTLNNDYSNKRKDLNNYIEKYNGEVVYLDNAFSNAERKTNVSVALIKLKITREINGKSILDSVLKDRKFNVNNEEYLTNALSNVVSSNEIDKKITDIERYVKMYEKGAELLKEKYSGMSRYSDFIESYLKDEGEYSYILNKNIYNDKDYSDELTSLRNYFWDKILTTKDFLDLLTNSTRHDVMSRLTEMKNLEINLTNIKMLLGLFMQNKDEMLKESCINVFKDITNYSIRDFSKNIHYYNGWKTNDCYKVNKKIIKPFYKDWDDYSLGKSYTLYGIGYESIDYSVREYMNDLNKMFTTLVNDGVNLEYKTIGLGEFENDIIRFKMFKKGTVHIWFKDLDLLNKFNYICSKDFGWLPTDEELKNNKDAVNFIRKEFGEDYIKLGHDN